MAIDDRVAPPKAEAPRTLDEAPPRLLGFADQFALWGNLGISLLLPVSAAFILVPVAGHPLSLTAAMVAIAVGTVIGNVLLGLSAIPGAETGMPSMVLLRGLFGRTGSYLPTVVNVLQCIGWSIFEVVVIADSAAKLTSDSLRWVWVLVAGGIATVMAVRPLGAVRMLKRVAVWLVLASTVYLFVQVLRKPLPPWNQGGWSGFWQAADLTVALSVSWIPLSADYSRHSRSGRAAFGGAALGYGVASAAYFVLGVFALAAFHLSADSDVIGALLAVPAGTIALLVLAIDELDEAFANMYSTAVSMQNVTPRVDRRVLALGVGVLSTVAALWFDIQAYESFLTLLGSVFVPLFGTFAVDYFIVQRRQWDVSEDAPARFEMVLPWLAGFVAYQLVNPGGVGWWSRFWIARAHDLHFTAPSWASASLFSLAVSAVLALVVGTTVRRTRASAPSPRPAGLD